MIRKRTYSTKKLQLFIKRFFPAGDYTWTVPPGCDKVDVFLVGGGGGGASGSATYRGGGGGGYTKTYKADETGWRDGGCISVISGQSIPIIVGKGGARGSNGGYSQFLNGSYQAAGGNKAPSSSTHKGGDGGSGGSRGYYYKLTGGSDGDGGKSSTSSSGDPTTGQYDGKGQGHTTRDFGEPDEKRNSGGGSGGSNYVVNETNINIAGESDYEEGAGTSNTGSVETRGGKGGGGYGGGGGGRTLGADAGAGGDGTVLIRYWAYEE